MQQLYCLPALRASPSLAAHASDDQMQGTEADVSWLDGNASSNETLYYYYVYITVMSWQEVDLTLVPPESRDTVKYYT